MSGELCKQELCMSEFDKLYQIGKDKFDYKNDSIGFLMFIGKHMWLAGWQARKAIDVRLCNSIKGEPMMDYCAKLIEETN